MNKIMVVDDEPDVANLITDILQSSGYKVIKTLNGPEALTKLESETPDLILLDIMMPDLSGWDVLKKVKENKKTTKIPIALLTAKKLDLETFAKDDLKKLVDYIEKPFTKQSLLNKVKELLCNIQETEDTLQQLKQIDPALAEEYARINQELLLFKNLKKTLENLINTHREQQPSNVSSFEHILKSEEKTLEILEKRKLEILQHLCTAK